MVDEREGVLVDAGGRRVGWMTRGVEGGRPVGYLHGQPGSRRDVRVFSDAELEQHGLLLFSVDRAGYGDTDAVGLDRRQVSRDLLTVADHLGIGTMSLLAVSMGGIYAVTAAALAPDRVTRIVLVSAHAMPYDDDDVLETLSDAERADLDLLRGPSDALEAAYAEAAAGASTTDGALALLGRLAASMSPLERTLADGPFARAVAASVAFGLAPGHRGLLDDGLRTLRAFEIDLADVRCPVRALHGTDDDLEPYPNLQRLLRRLEDTSVITFPGMGHFAPWVWPGLVLDVVAGP